NIGVPVESCQHEDPGVGLSAANLFRRLNAIFDGHSQIHQNHVRINFQKQLDGLRTVGCFTNHMHVRLGVDDRKQSDSDDEMVIGHENANLLPIFHETVGDTVVPFASAARSKATRTSSSVPCPG